MVSLSGLTTRSMRKIKFKRNKDGISVTFCPNGFTTFVGNRRKRVGDDCLFCKYRKHVDYDRQIVECNFVRNGCGKRK